MKTEGVELHFYACSLQCFFKLLLIMLHASVTTYGVLDK
jgi:hypothetical protein